ncbi:MAG TPA: hypothetical protein PL131_11160 [Methylotenera sp.]|nr:hypothetical protein [Methylotenera sp.]HPH06425.1 hypothetical protein [Methylotenera sp.]HPN00428.1 hypothetical protein [Methylotenera sp.]
MIHQPPFTIKSPLHDVTIIAWHKVSLRNFHVAIPNQHFKNGEQITITVHPDGCLLLYPITTWTPIENMLKKLATNKLERASKSEPSALERLLNSVSNETIHDQRVGIPEMFLNYAALDDEVIWAETATHVQLWQPARFAEKIAQSNNHDVENA